MTFFDYTAYSPKEELTLAFQKTASKSLSDVGSLEGRAVCLLRLAIHAACIAFKPLYYLAVGILSKFTLHLIVQLPASLIENDERIDLDAYRKHPELHSRAQSQMIWLIFAAPAAVLSQIVQVFKAALGILYPGIYFKEDELAPYTDQLAAIAREVECTPDLIERLDRGSEIIHKSLRAFPNAPYFHAEFKRDLAIISEKLSGPELSATHKLALLSMLEPEPEGSGIEACPGGLGRILQQICADVEIPEDLQKVIPYLSENFKCEVIHRMVMQSEATNNEENRPAWHSVIQGLAHDPAHRGNALILELNVFDTEKPVERARQDLTVERVEPLSGEKKDLLLDAFYELCTPEAMTAAVQNRINSQPDGSPGLKTFRNQAMQILSDLIARENPAEPDPATLATQRYYLHGGLGDPSDPSFSDLNPEAIRALRSEAN